MSNPLTAIKKLKNPPAAHNWVKNIRPRTDDTAQSLYNMALFGPRHSLRPVTDIIRNIVVDGISDETAFKCLQGISDPKVRSYGFHILRAFLPYARQHDLHGIEIFKTLVEYYHLAKEVAVPIRPRAETQSQPERQRGGEGYA